MCEPPNLIRGLFSELYHSRQTDKKRSYPTLMQTLTGITYDDDLIRFVEYAMFS